MFGKLLDYEELDNKVILRFENGVSTIEILCPDIVRVFCDFSGINYKSQAIEECRIKRTEIKIKKEDYCLKIYTGELIIKVYDNFKVDFYNAEEELLCRDYRKDREALGRKGDREIAALENLNSESNTKKYKITIAKEFIGDEHFYGLGENTGFLNKRGYAYEMWNTDNPTPHVESFKSLYKSIPFFITLINEKAYGIYFDNNFKTYFDMGKENPNYFYFAGDKGNLDYYFIYGPDVKKVVEQYTYLTGRTPLPQKWTLGYQQCRWGYHTEDRVKEIANEFRERDIPCDTIYLDIDYMDGFRVFTWNKDNFKNPRELSSWLKEKGFKLVTIIDPGVKKDKGYGIYDEGLKNGYFAVDKDDIPYINRVWPGDSVYPDFGSEDVRAWWAQNQKIMIDSGVSGIWNDMNEPASFNGPLPDDVRFMLDNRETDHTEVHNVYGHLMSKATYEGLKEHTGKRPFVVTRAAFAGTQKYACVWTGDNQSFWEHLRMSIPMLLNLGLSGFSFCGTDVGGFQFDCTKELLTRWIQVGCFTPFFRNHSCTFTRDQEPWAFGEETESINRKYIKLRYKLLPYLYDLMKESEDKGLPIMRPIMFHYQKDINTYEINDEFLFGENILVAPILEQGKKFRSVYLPSGRWIDYWTKEIIDGNKYIIKQAPLDTCPIYIKAGTIIPNYEDMNFVDEKEIRSLILDIYPGYCNYNHYLDDGESFDYKSGCYNLYNFKMYIEEEKMVMESKIINKGYSKNYDNITCELNCLEPRQIIVNGEIIDFKYENRVTTFEIPCTELKIEIL